MERNLIDVNEDISKLGLSNRVENGLRRVNLDIIRDVIEVANTKGLSSIRNLGNKSIQEIEQQILDKCNVSIARGGYAELSALNLSSRAFSILIKKYGVTTLEEVLNLYVHKNNSLKYLNSNIKSEKEIIDKVHELGYVFCDEKEEGFSLEDDVSKLNLSRLLTVSLYNYGVYTIRDLLDLSMKKDGSCTERSIYHVRGFGEKKVQELIKLIQSIGFQLNVSRKDEVKKQNADSNIKYEDNDFWYREGKLNFCVLFASKNLKNGTREYELSYDVIVRDKYLMSFYDELSIYQMKDMLYPFVQDEFSKFLSNFKVTTKDILEIKINKLFSKYSNMDNRITTLSDKVFSEFRKVLTLEYVHHYFFNIVTLKKEHLKENKKYNKLMT